MFLFRSFSIGNLSSNYTLNVSGYNGTAGKNTKILSLQYKNPKSSDYSKEKKIKFKMILTI